MNSLAPRNRGQAWIGGHTVAALGCELSSSILTSFPFSLWTRIRHRGLQNSHTALLSSAATAIRLPLFIMRLPPQSAIRLPHSPNSPILCMKSWLVNAKNAASILRVCPKPKVFTNNILFSFILSWLSSRRHHAISVQDESGKQNNSPPTPIPHFLPFLKGPLVLTETSALSAIPAWLVLKGKRGGFFH